MYRRTVSGFLIAAAGVSAPLGSAADAATSATINLSATLPKLAQLSGLKDVLFTNISQSADSSSTQAPCAWTNSTTGIYTITATGDGGGSAFTLKNTAGNTVPYVVGWSGSAGATSTTSLTASAASPQFKSIAVDPLCATGASVAATLTITIRAADASTMIGGTTYTGVLTLLMTPV